MKRLFVTLFILVIGYAVFYDIKIGTLPFLSSYPIQKETVALPQGEKATYKNIEVKSGDTALSIVEAISKSKSPSIEKVVADFKKLNPGESPSKLRIGKTYKFPIYQ
ncbi:LysM peptidoglycan-binding domain-containing protein [Ectobacillus antri]|jgi:hypothetical protein|uniref:LysM peptidoglycan-binding domain-containing protein n=1 Tax=Ectobacillus antri TaxID=2486280 RepID=A0ABT6H3S3_9BACI|nr:LysM peptidoglycan-binding domain-containing protein [Ectobacillus antri]MDG4655517.1 LysM peptidoglycan-binding domain-containing protein [Ectobacillus antri]MDG5753275.1 LysM peptidoglycan-binding domain-containing protein [Ectobacillus antri]